MGEGGRCDGPLRTFFSRSSSKLGLLASFLVRKFSSLTFSPSLAWALGEEGASSKTDRGI